jgi:hypothetical protein
MLALKKQNIRPPLVTRRPGLLLCPIQLIRRIQTADRILYVLDEHRSDDGAMYFKKLLKVVSNGTEGGR